MRHLLGKISFSTYLIVVFGCAAFIGLYKFLGKRFKEIRTDINYVRTQVTQLGAPEDLVDSYTAADIARQVVMSAMSEQAEAIAAEQHDEGSHQVHRYEQSLAEDYTPFAGADDTLLQPTVPQEETEGKEEEGYPQQQYIEYEPTFEEDNTKSVPSIPYVLEVEETKNEDSQRLVELD